MIEKLWKGFPKSVLLESIRSQRPSISQSISAVPFTGGAPIITVSVVQDPRNFLSTSWFFPGSVHFFIFAISLAMSGGSCGPRAKRRSEEHTSELQSLRHLVCRLLLEKKKKHIR